MSFPSSPHGQTLADHHDALRDALVEVAENSFFAFVEPCELDRFQELAEDVPAWIAGSVLFEGSFCGAVLVVVPEALARELCSAFLGAEPGVVALDGPLFDLVGEFANMVCGSWLTRCAGRQAFNLRHPEVSRLRGEDVKPETDDCLLLAVNDQPCLLRLAFLES